MAILMYMYMLCVCACVQLELHAFKEPILSELRAAQQEKAQLEQVIVILVKELKLILFLL